jgi:hypothetical protein
MFGFLDGLSLECEAQMYRLMVMDGRLYNGIPSALTNEAHVF